MTGIRKGNLVKYEDEFGVVVTKMVLSVVDSENIIVKTGLFSSPEMISKDRVIKVIK